MTRVTPDLRSLVSLFDQLTDFLRIFCGFFADFNDRIYLLKEEVLTTGTEKNSTLVLLIIIGSLVNLPESIFEGKCYSMTHKH